MCVCAVRQSLHGCDGGLPGVRDDIPGDLLDQLPHPAMCLVVLQQGAPGNFEFHRRYVKRGRQDQHRGVVRLQKCTSGRHRCNKILLFTEQHGRLVMARKYRDAALLPSVRQGVIHPSEALDVFRVDPHPHPHPGFGAPYMLGLQVTVEIEPVGNGVIGVEHAGKAVLPDSPLVEGLGHVIKPIDDHVDLALFYIPECDVTGSEDVHNDARSIASQIVGQPGQQRCLGIVACHNAKHPLAAGGVKARLWLNEMFYAGQDISHLWLQFGGTLRRRHTLTGANQERIIKQFSQAAQAVAHGWLADTQSLGGAGNVPLAQQGVEMDQQVEVDLVQVHGTVQGI